MAVRIRATTIQVHSVGIGTIIANRPNAVRVANQIVRSGAATIAVAAPRRPIAWIVAASLYTIIA